MKNLGLLLFCFSIFILPLYAKGSRENTQDFKNPYSGEGGKNLSITIKVLTADGLPSGLSNIPVLAYRTLIENFRKYSGILIRPDLDFDDSLYREVLSGFYDDDDEAAGDLGHLRMTGYLMTGSITLSPLGYHLYLQAAKTAVNDKSVAFSFSDNCTYSELVSLSIVNRASLDLLEQMGVKLNEWARTELAGTNAANRARGRTIMIEAEAAQMTGDEAKARFLFNQAAELDKELAKEAQKRLLEMDKPLVMLTSEKIPSPVLLPPPQLLPFIPAPEKQAPQPGKITGNLGQDARARQQAFDMEQENERIRKEIEAENERIRIENKKQQDAIEAENKRRQDAVDAENRKRQDAIAEENKARDAHNREIWVKALADCEEYYRNYLGTVEPFELVYENKIYEMPETQDFKKGTMSLRFNAALVPVESRWTRAVENDVNSLRSQLKATGRAEAWGLANWPMVSVTNPQPFIIRNGRIFAAAELLNDEGKVLGSANFSFNWNLTVNFNEKGLSFYINEDILTSMSVNFNDINIYDITDALQIRISKINGEGAEQAASRGGIQYGTDYRRWKAIERGQQRRQAQRVSKENVINTGKFIFNYLLPHYYGIGTALTTPLLVLSAYNRIFLGNVFMIDFGCDFGFFHPHMGVIKDVNYFSFYPFGHLGFASYTNYGGTFIGLGIGCMLASYSYPNDTVKTVTTALDITAGFRIQFVDFSYTMRIAELVNHKIQVGFRLIPVL
ncbi:MAG: hypothetical protein LBH16_03315 [Treponema sp.]|jgi:hypothetical protein|nr:hypothetical protein [Treponema sp.]